MLTDSIAGCLVNLRDTNPFKPFFIMNMNTRFNTLSRLASARSVADMQERNRVLRNTYWLLALSMVPTVLGAWLGVTTGIAAMMSGGLGMIVFLAGAFGFMFAIEKTKESTAGVPVLLAFTFFMGLMLSRLVGSILGLANGASLIMTAFAGTGVIFLGMASLSSIIKRDLSAMDMLPPGSCVWSQPQELVAFVQAASRSDLQARGRQALAHYERYHTPAAMHAALMGDHQTGELPPSPHVHRPDLLAQALRRARQVSIAGLFSRWVRRWARRLRANLA